MEDKEAEKGSAIVLPFVQAQLVDPQPLPEILLVHRMPAKSLFPQVAKLR